MKKVYTLVAMAAILAMPVSAMAAESKTATPSDAAVMVEGQAIDIGAYNIDGYNYFKLRDVAAAMNNTDAHFEVGYDSAAKSIALTANHAYTATGSELQDKPTENKEAVVSDQKILLNGAEVTMQAYLIDGYNYFQLRELGDNLGFNVGWDNETKTITLTAGEKTENEAVPTFGVKGETYTKADLQKILDSASENEEFILRGTYMGSPNDEIAINDKVIIHGEDAVIQNITLKIDTTEPISLDNITFEGNKESNIAIFIVNAGDTIISECMFNNYMENAVFVRKIEDGGTISINKNVIYEYGLADGQQAAIAYSAMKQHAATIEITNNVFRVLNDDNSRNADYPLITYPRDSKGGELSPLYKDMYLKFVDNQIWHGYSFSEVKCYTQIPESHRDFGDVEIGKPTTDEEWAKMMGK